MEENTVDKEIESSELEGSDSYIDEEFEDVDSEDVPVHNYVYCYITYHKVFCKQGKVFEVVVSDGPADRSVKPVHHTSGMNVRVIWYNLV